MSRSLAIQELASGPEHPDVALSLNNLAALFTKQVRVFQHCWNVGGRFLCGSSFSAISFSKPGNSSRPPLVSKANLAQATQVYRRSMPYSDEVEVVTTPILNNMD